MAVTALLILDGFGIGGSDPKSNAILAAGTPNIDRLKAEYCSTAIGASGLDVGLPDGQMGNSEVGHTNIGAGRVVYQMLVKITKDIEDGVFFENKALLTAMENCKKNGSALHLIGLVSPGGVHSHTRHLYGLLEMAKRHGLEKVYVHCLLDGRDVPPDSGWEYVQELVDKMNELGVGKVATVMGRLYAMDRDNAWERVEKAYNAMVFGEGIQASDPVQAIKDSYQVVDETGKHLTDEFVLPTVIDKDGMVKANDSVVFFNFRPDRARELTRAMADPSFDGFARGAWPQVGFVCLTEYDPDIPAPVAFPKEFPEDVLADVLAAAGLRQYHIAETEKYAHVTFFFNGGREEPKAGEERALIPSPKVATYDLQPEMSEPEVARTLAAAIDADAADVYVVNFANPDMVGHTGVIPAAVAAVEAVDAGVGEVLAALKRKGGVALVTADHGNADKMIADDGTPHTAHTTALVPLVLVDYAGTGRELDGRQGALCDIAPTLLALMGLDAPQAMTGKSLLA